MRSDFRFYARSGPRHLLAALFPDSRPTKLSKFQPVETCRDLSSPAFFHLPAPSSTLSSRALSCMVMLVAMRPFESRHIDGDSALPPVTMC